MFTYALTRRPGVDCSEGLTTASLGKPDFDRLIEQYEAYVSALQERGLTIVELDPLPGYPDAYFVEDTAVVTPEVAVITNPGAPQRQGEEESIAAALSPYRPAIQITPPGTLDGGDVLQVGSHFFIGLSERTNRAGCEQLGSTLEQHGYTWSAVPVTAGPHLKSSVNAVGDDVLLVSETFASHTKFNAYKLITLEPEEEYAGNTLLINETLLTPAGYPRTRDALEKLGRPIIELDMSEVRKMDGGLTCLSIRF